MPDAMVTPPQAPARRPGARGAGTDPGNPTTPQSGICPTDPAKPLLEPEALQTMHAAYTDPSDPAGRRTWPRARASRSRSSPTASTSTTPTSSAPTARTSSSTTRTSPARARTPRPAPPRRSATRARSPPRAARSTTSRRSSTRRTRCRRAATSRVRGMAPGASLIGMKVFGKASSAFTSVIIQGIDWAVTHDHADILSESFGGYPIPDTALDAITPFNDAAVAAGVTVSQGTGDSGATAGPSSPGSDPLVLDAGGEHELPRLRADGVVRVPVLERHLAERQHLVDRRRRLRPGRPTRRTSWRPVRPTGRCARRTRRSTRSARTSRQRRARAAPAVRRHQPVGAAHRGRRRAR